jgi:hypothetical protein
MVMLRQAINGVHISFSGARKRDLLDQSRT